MEEMLFALGLGVKLLTSCLRAYQHNGRGVDGLLVAVVTGCQHLFCNLLFAVGARTFA